MNIEIHEVPLDKKAILKGFLNDYLVELAPYAEDDPSQHDPLEYPYFDFYWTEPNRIPLFIIVDEQMAGFVLVRTDTQDHTSGGEAKNTIAEFYVIPQLRLQGIGEQVATWIFSTYPGKWMVAQLAKHSKAQKFWRTIICRYTQGYYEEVFHNNERWFGPVQYFDNTKFKCNE